MSRLAAVFTNTRFWLLLIVAGAALMVGHSGLPRFVAVGGVVVVDLGLGGGRHRRHSLFSGPLGAAGPDVTGAGAAPGGQAAGVRPPVRTPAAS
jgi:hypothetical protein